MHNKSYKKAVVFAICLTMLMPLGSMVVSSTDESSSQADSSAAVKDTDSSAEVRAELDLCKHLSVYLRSVFLLDLI